MKKLLLTMVLSLCLAGTAAAQIGWSADQIGIYFDEAGSQFCGVAGPSTMPQAYLVIKNAQYGVAGWECQVAVVPPADGLVLSYNTLGTGPINIYTPPDFMVGLGVPFPRAGAVVVAAINLFVGGPDPWLFYVRALPPQLRPSIPGYPAYAAAEDPDILSPLFVSSGDQALPVAQLNGDCAIVATQDDTWGGVKGMYR